MTAPTNWYAMKKCATCGKEKNLAYFGKSGGVCSACVNKPPIKKGKKAHEDDDADNEAEDED